MPIFNKDYKFYTPSFILEEEKVKLVVIKKFYSENDERLQRKHYNRVEEYASNDESIVRDSYKTSYVRSLSFLILRWYFSWFPSKIEKPTIARSAGMIIRTTLR